MAFYRSFAPLAPLALAFSVVAAPPAAAHGPDNVADLVENILPATVSITTRSAAAQPNGAPPTPFQLPPGTPFEDFFRDFNAPNGTPPNGGGAAPGPNAPAPQAPSSGAGSGFVVDGDECHIVTNNHVVEGSDSVTVTFSNGRTYNATVLGTDTAVDLAVLKCDADQPVPEVSFGDSSAMRIGDWVLAIGNPLGLSNTVTTGIVSQLGRELGGTYDNYIQTDTAINRGNSGGALFNERGEVIGINTAIFSPNGGSIGLGFSIPSNTARGVVAQLIEHGEVRRGYLGAQIQNVPQDQVVALGLAEARGALVQAITPDSPAADAGLMAGDVITRFNGQDVGTIRELLQIIADTPIGAEAEVTYMRGGIEMTGLVTVGDRKAMEAEQPQPATAAPVLPAPSPH